jgi:hypothetical protein
MQPSARHWSRLIALVPLILLPPWVGPAHATECTIVMMDAKGVSMDAPRQTWFSFFNPVTLGELDPRPLIETKIDVRGECVLAHFSVQGRPQDPLDVSSSFMLFQVSIDDVPMLGHTQFNPAFNTLVVWDADEGRRFYSRTLAYNFVARVTPGVHVVRVRFTGCCHKFLPSFKRRCSP